ncbi:DUF1440 domain-containing protein [Nafulsella turpanensis]|uniref:DUF1440 domain-containing protein n=1 Tax=Nafulsella turpanensis TaxID=1265690 RepID=UPI000349D78F|nr:DUF1440 domain-containing protein [Nafulsella turpanensis]
MASAWKEIVKGAVAGAASVWMMDRVTWYMYNHEDREAYKQEKKAQKGGKYVAFVAADKIANAIGARRTDKQKYVSGKTIHYLLGIMPGALYGLLRHKVDGLDKGRGLLYGLGLFLVMDELVAPLTGLSSGPLAYPWQAHARGLAGHLTVGATTDAAVRALDKVVPA